MTEDEKIEAEAKVNAEEIARADATQGGPRGNVHSVKHDEPDQHAPPPLPH